MKKLVITSSAIVVALVINLSFGVISSLSSYSSQLKKSVDAIITPFMESESIPGVAVALQKGQVGILLSYGVANVETGVSVLPETIFELASITKVFTAIELALQVQNGRMKLSDPVGMYLPLVFNKGKAINQVTLLELATHSSSLPRGMPESQNIMRFLERWRPKYPIGTHYQYSNIAFGLLGDALAHSANKPYEVLIKENILDPLGMHSTMIHVPNDLKSHYAQGYHVNGTLAPARADNAWPAAGALRSSSQDMLKFLQANMGIAGPQELLEAMQFVQKEYFEVRPNFSQGLAWGRVRKNGLLIIEKNGGLPGFSTYIGMIPEKNIGVVILMNKEKGKCTEIGRRILLSI